MRKIPTIFLRDEQDRRYVTGEPHPHVDWLADPGVLATRKYDGTCLLLDDDGGWWARREVKPGKERPANYRVVETDAATGKTVGWEPLDQSPFYRHMPVTDTAVMMPGTYELIGPKVNGNPEQMRGHAVIAHADADELDDVPTDFDGLREYLTDFPHEGIVWHHPDGRMAKLKRRDFDL